MRQARENMKPSLIRNLFAIALSGVIVAAYAESDLPPDPQVESALNSHLMVLNANSVLKQEYANQRRWNSGNYEFNVNMGTGQRTVGIPRDKLREWYVDIQRPVRLFNKMQIDEEIGLASVARADFAFRDARHEAARQLLRLWFVWQREQATGTLWQKQVEILSKLVAMTDSRVKKGDAPKLELNQAKAAVAQANVSLQQAQLREQLAGNDLLRQFPSVRLPEKMSTSTPQAIAQSFPFWKDQVFEHSNELAMVRAQAQLQQLLAQRSRADTTPDPTLGVRVASDMGGNEKVLSMYVSVPISFGLRSANADAMEQQAVMAADQEAFVKRRLEGDAFAAHTQAVRSYSTWQQAREAAQAIRNNAEMVAMAYTHGESSLSDSLTARRLALESSLAEQLALLDANEARYRLMLDTHQLWQAKD
jgi:outer membrane protein TolC